MVPASVSAAARGDLLDHEPRRSRRERTHHRADLGGLVLAVLSLSLWPAAIRAADRPDSASATDLRSMTQGRGVFTMEFDHYEVVPQHLTADIIEAHKKEQEEKEE